MNRYLAAALAAKIDCDDPDTDWLVQWLYEIAQNRSVRIAQDTVNALSHYFRCNNLPNPLADPHVASLLYDPSAIVVDPTGELDLARMNLAAPLLHRVRFYHDAAYTDGYKKMSARYVESWKVFAREHGFDPSQPTAAQLAAFLTMLADHNKAAQTIASALTSLRHYFRACGHDNVTRSKLVQTTLQGIRRAHPPSSLHPLFVDDVRKMVSDLGERERDVRDRVIVLCLLLGGLKPLNLRSLDRSKVLVLDEQVVLAPVGDYRKEAIIGGVDDPQLDLRIWMIKWLRFVGVEKGPLFPAPHRRGGFATTPLAGKTINELLQRLAKRSGIGAWRVSQGLRQGFVIDGVRKIGIVATAQHLGYKTIAALEQYSPLVTATGDKLRMLSGRGPRTYGRGRAHHWPVETASLSDDPER